MKSQLFIPTNKDAQAVTHFERADSSPSVSEKVEIADQLMEKAFKWGNRVIQIAAWLEKGCFTT